MAEGKWISGLSWTTPTEEAARNVLRSRFDVVRRYLPLAMEQSTKDIEYIHQLRVGTRRANAALRLFERNIPEKIFRSARRLLRRLRRAAGEARDWDVFRQVLADVRGLHTDRGRPALYLLEGYIAARRMDAQITLLEVGQKRKVEWEEVNSKLIEAIHPSDDAAGPACFGELALGQLGKILEAFQQAASQAPNTYEALHQIRILGKRLRYAMEVFVDCFGPAYREQLYVAIEELQELLGQLTDSHFAAEVCLRLRTHMQSYCPAEWPTFKKSIDNLLQLQRRRFPRARERFLAWWPRWQALLQEHPLEQLALREAVVDH